MRGVGVCALLVILRLLAGDAAFAGVRVPDPAVPPVTGLSDATYAVWAFEGFGVGTQEAEVVTRSFRNALFQRGGLRILDRAGMEQLAIEARNLPWNGDTIYVALAVDDQHNLAAVQQGQAAGKDIQVKLNLKSPGVALLTLRPKAGGAE